MALFVGLVIGNTLSLPAWFSEALRTEYYVKTGIVLMGATLPFTIILRAGPAAIGQALIVSVVTFASIYFAATRLFGLDRRFAATLGAGGSICGVFRLDCHRRRLPRGEGARFHGDFPRYRLGGGDDFRPARCQPRPRPASGCRRCLDWHVRICRRRRFAAAEAIGHEAATEAFTLMKVVGRDMFVGIWAFLVAILAVTVWERQSAAQSERIDRREIWRRFPKFILGFSSPHC